MSYGAPPTQLTSEYILIPMSVGMVAYTFEMATEHFANANLSLVVAKCWFLGFVV